MLWDGSYIGEVEFKNLKKSPKFWEAEVNGERCRIYNYKDSTPLILDEIKPYFDLPKVGRHKCKVDKDFYILSKIEGYTYRKLGRDDIDDLEDEIIRTMMFQAIFNIWNQPLKNLVIREYTLPSVGKEEKIKEVLSFVDCTIAKNDKINFKEMKEFYPDKEDLLKAMHNFCEKYYFTIDILRDIVKRIDKTQTIITNRVKDNFSRYT